MSDENLLKTFLLEKKPQEDNESFSYRGNSIASVGALIGILILKFSLAFIGLLGIALLWQYMMARPYYCFIKSSWKYLAYLFLVISLSPFVAVMLSYAESLPELLGYVAFIVISVSCAPLATILHSQGYLEIEEKFNNKVVRDSDAVATKHCRLK